MQFVGGKRIDLFQPLNQMFVTNLLDFLLNRLAKIPIGGRAFKESSE